MDQVFPRIYGQPSQSFFLFGLRGVGKSTWAKLHYPEAFRIDLLDEGLYQAYLVNPDLFAGEMRRLQPKQWVVVDEIQRLPGLLNQVHRFIEEKKLRFVLLGSSARKLKTAGTNLLAGRALRRNMFPLVPEELGKRFLFGEVLRFGSLPLVVQSQTKQEVLQAYAELYLKEEIRAEAVVRNLAGFARFLPIAALFHGQALNIASLARDSGTARTTVAGYLDILEDTLLAYRLPAYEAKLRVRERKHPKLYWTDPGVMRAAKRQLGPPTAEEMGALIEGWVGTMLRTYGEVRSLYEDLCYWAPAEAAHTEVDFLLRRGQEFLAIEVKAGQRLSNEVFSGLRAISDLKRLVRRVLIYQGSRELKTSDGIEVLPVESFIRCLHQDTLWP
jgi:uncharacterized protein